MPGNANRANRMGATAIVSKERLASSSSTSEMAPLELYPAQLIKPRRRSPDITCSHRSLSVTSITTVSTSRPASAAAFATIAAFSSERTEPIDRHPRWANSSAVTKPIPEFAPVVRTAFSRLGVNRILFNLLLNISAQYQRRDETGLTGDRES
jgi:hypothetical protein